MHQRIDGERVLGDSCLSRPVDRPGWATGKDGPRYVVRPGHGYMRKYAPMDEQPGLHAALAHVELTEDGIADFVQRFGFLGIEREFTTKEGCAEVGEVWSGWENEVTQFRAIWDLVHGRSKLKLKPVETMVILADGRMATRWKFMTAAGGGEIVAPSEEDARELALIFLMASNLRRGVGAFMRQRGDGQGVALYFAPKTVLGAAYLQLAHVFETEEPMQWSECPSCRKWHPSRKACGNPKCRRLRYEANRDMAYRLRTEGLSPTTIARRMGATTRQVSAWIAAAKKRQGKGRR